MKKTYIDHNFNVINGQFNKLINIVEKKLQSVLQQYRFQ